MKEGSFQMEDRLDWVEFEVVMKKCEGSEATIEIRLLSWIRSIWRDQFHFDRERTLCDLYRDYVYGRMILLD